MGTSTLFPLKPASRLTTADRVWPSLTELRCGECGYSITARRELPLCPMCGSTAGWEAPAPYRSAPSIRRAR